MKLIAFILLQFSSIQNEIINDLRAFQNQDGISHGIVAASIQRLSDSKSVIAFNEDKAINSASTLKLITTASVISSLGPDFKYATDIAYTGSIKEGELDGNLIITGNGDPSFGSSRGINPSSSVIKEIITTLNSLGIRLIKGNIIINDETVFDYDMPDSWIWGDMGNYYGAIPYKFNYNENQYTVYFEPGNEIGADAEVNSLNPFDPDWRIINLVKTGTANSGDQVYIYSSPGSDVIIMKGTVPIGKSNFPVKGAIPNPAKLFRTHIIQSIEEEGIVIQERDLKPLAKDLPRVAQQLHLVKRFHSQRLEDLARDCNFSSINIYADAFLHTLNRNLFEGFNDGLKTLKGIWKDKANIGSGFNPKDGSGLSPSGYITTRNMTNILTSMSKEPYFGNYESTIPILGKEGSVRYKDRAHITGERVRAKSGSIESTRAYAGYFEDKTGEKYSFMIGVNHYDKEATRNVRSFLDDFLIKIGSK